MPRCDLEIELEQSDRTFRPGDWILGAVTVRVDDAVKCRRLAASLVWRTHGKGQRDEGEGEQLALFEGELVPGEHHYPFRFMAPSLPATYHGHLVNVDHYVSARADIPWALDAKAEADILVVGGNAADFTAAPGKGVTAADIQKAQRAFPNVAVGCGGLVALACLVIMVVSVGIDILTGGRLKDMLLALLSTFPAPLFFALGLGAVVWGVLRKMRAARLGEPEVSVEPREAMVGGPVTVDLAINPRADVVLEDAWFELVCKETAMSGSGTSKTRHHHDVFRERQSFEAGGTTIPAGQPVRRRGRLSIPSGAPVSFAAENNRVGWFVEARVKVQGWPGWSTEVPLTVRAASSRL